MVDWRDMRILVVGLGSIGRRHIANLRRLGCRRLAVLRRPESPPPSEPIDNDVTCLITSAEGESWEPQAVIVASVTSAHSATVRWALQLHAHVFVEKPAAVRPSELAGLSEQARKRGLVVGVGYNLRFHPALEMIRDAVLSGRYGRPLYMRSEVGSYLPDWHPWTDYRSAYSGRLDLGGGAALTLIHEIDYTLWILGAVRVTAGRIAQLPALEMAADNLCELTCEHESGVLSSIHMDFLDRGHLRRCRCVLADGTLEWTHGQSLKLETGSSTTVLWNGQGFDMNATYLDELADFFMAVQDGRESRATLGDAKAALEVINAVR